MCLAQSHSTVTRARILVRGIVQGVGFRPFVYSLALRRGLRGRVLNNASGVLIDVEGEEEAIEQLVEELRTCAPPLASIESIERGDRLDPAHYTDFRIVESDAHGETRVPV